MAGEEYQTYRSRWLMLGLVCLGSFARIYLASSFEVCNEVVTNYFQTTPYATDALAVVDFVIAAGVCLAVAFVGPWIGGVRCQSIALVSCLFISAVTAAFAFISRGTYWIVAVGRVISGFSAGLLSMLPPILASAWFPPNEIATAYALPSSFLSVGGVLSVPVFSATVPQLGEITESGSGGEIATEDESDDIYAVKLPLMVNYGIIALLLFIGTSLLCVYARDKPPTPPSAAQAKLLKMDEVNKQRAGSNRRVIGSRVTVMKSLICSRAFVFLTTANCLDAACLSIAAYLSSSMVRASFPKIDSITSSYILMTSAIGGALGGVTTGRILDRFGSFKPICLTGITGELTVAIGIYFGHYYKTLPGLFILYAMLLFFRTSTITSYVQFVAEATYPADRSIVMSLHFAFWNLGPFVFASFERMLMTPENEKNAVLVPITTSVISLVLVALVKPSYKRSRNNKGESKEEYELLEGDNRRETQEEK